MLQIEYPHSSSPFAIRSRRILCTFFIYFLFRFFVVQYLVLYFCFYFICVGRWCCFAANRWVQLDLNMVEWARVYHEARQRTHTDFQYEIGFILYVICVAHFGI